MSSQTQDLPDLQDYLAKKDRQLHDRLKQLNEARKHLQGFAELEELLIKKDEELQQQVAQLTEASRHLKDTGTSNGRGPAKSACPVHNVSTQDNRSPSPHVETAATLREQLSQQPSHGHTPELVSQPGAGTSRSLADEVIASQTLQPKCSEAVSCTECGRKTGRIPSAVNQLCSRCRSGEGRSSILSPSAALEGHEESNENNKQLSGMVGTGPRARTISPPSNGLPVERQKRDFEGGTSYQRDRYKARKDGDSETTDECHAKNYPTIMWFNGAYREFWCFRCGSNVTDFDDGSSKRSRAPGQWWQGIKGLCSHVTNKHHVNPADHGFDASIKKMGWYEVAQVCMKKNLARRLSEEDVERIENRLEPSVPIVKKVSFKKTFLQAKQEYRKRFSETPPVRSRGYMAAEPAAEEAVNGSTPSYKHSRNYSTHTTALGTWKDTESESHHRSPHLSDYTAGTANKTNGARDVFDYDSRGLNRSKGAGKVAENYAYESDEDDEDDTPIAPKRRRVTDQTYTSDT